MTTEKAIDILTIEKEYYILKLTTSNDNYYDKIQALDMAINSLSANYKYEWCKGCREYDTENHCRHRYSSFIRESLQDCIDAVLEDIKAEIKAIQPSWYEYAGRYNAIDDVLKIIEKHISGKE